MKIMTRRNPERAPSPRGCKRPRQSNHLEGWGRPAWECGLPNADIGLDEGAGFESGLPTT